MEISFSPKGSFLSTWERTDSSDPVVKEAHQNLLIHHLPTTSIFFACAQKSQTDWKPQWTQDESQFAIVCTPGVLQFYAAQSSPCTLLNTLTSDQLRHFSLSPGVQPHIALFVPEGKKNGVPAMVKLFSLKNLTVPLSTKTFFKTDNVRFLWNRLGTGLLILTSTDIDATGKSYYGQNNLYCMNTVAKFDCRVPLDGPIHDVSWAANSKDFAVIYGFMPSKTVLFSHRADPIFDFGTSSRNTLSFSPNGRILCIGGFGNLPGELDFWDLVDMKKLVTVSCPNSTYLEWSPDGRYLLTATLAPRLRVDNGWKLWHYRGACFSHVQLPVVLQVGWCPSLTPPDLNAWKQRSLSPAPNNIIQVTPLQASAKYIPPSARRQGPLSSSQASTSTPPVQQVVGATLLKPLPSKKRGPSSPNVSQELNVAKQTHLLATPSHQKNKSSTSLSEKVGPEKSMPMPPPQMDEKKKKKIILQKKLKQIQALKKKKETGDTLTSTQESKLKIENSLRQALKGLSVE
ncbi:hypothetical protein HMI55_005424 [Coelomomyces lativittatus]|nr:hypothetical protein HMI56_002970 [Coelomomyces lativittatus]KAJ1513581.1 hypothetical protein HMI55_005424 [Coelomomyces lativittatus]